MSDPLSAINPRSNQSPAKEEGLLMLALEAWAMVGIHVCGTTWSVAVTVARRLLLQLLAGRCRWPKRSGPRASRTALF